MADWSSLLPPYVPVRLPSEGRFYGNIPDLAEGFVNIREYAAPEESLLASANRDNLQRVISAVLAGCIQGDIDVGELTSEDAYYLIVWLRANSYSPQYDVDVACPHCSPGNPSSYSIDLSKLEIKYLPPDVREPIEVILPATGLRVTLRVIRRKDEVRVEDRVSEVLRYHGAKGDPIDLLRRACAIAKVIHPSGEEVTDRASIEDLCINYLWGKDSLFLDDKLRTFDHGLVPRASIMCNACGKEFVVTIPPTTEFFRPSRYLGGSPSSDAPGDLGPVDEHSARRNVSENDQPEGQEDTDPHIEKQEQGGVRTPTT